MNTSEKYIFPFFESIRVENGEFQNTKYHLQRMMFTCLRTYNHFDFSNLLEDIVVPDEFREGLVKLKVYYNESQLKFKFSTYERKPAEKLRMIEGGDILYDKKRTDRKAIELLTGQKGDCDDILIIKDGLVTDTSIANILFFHDNIMLTPSDCLLAGTERQRLLKEGLVDAVKIKTEDIPYFDGFCIINAMNPFGSRPIIPVTNIISLKP